MSYTPVAERMQSMTAGEVLQKLPALCRQKRMENGLSIGLAVEVIGLSSKSVLHNLENGGEPRLDTIKRVVRWTEDWI